MLLIGKTHDLTEYTSMASSSKKRTLAEREDDFFQCAGLGVADASVRKIIARLRKGDPQETSGKQRSCEKRYQHITDCLRYEALEGIDGKPVEIYSTSLEKYIGRMCQQNQEYAAVLEETLKSELEKTPEGVSGVIYLDECVPGNILAPDNKRKAYLVYFAFTPCAKFRSLHFWYPLALLRHTQTDLLPGGVPRYFMHVLKQELLDFIGCMVGETIVPITKIYFVADEAALKAACGTKGSSGLRPCLRCDCFSREREGLAHRLGKATISCSDFVQFTVVDDNEVRDILVHLQWIRNNKSRKDLDEAQKLLGWTLNDHCCFLDEGISRYLQLSQCHYDAMHCYWSNGQVNCEVGFFYTEAVRIAGLTRSHLEMFFDSGWRKTCSIGGALSPGSLKGLVNQKILKEGQDYKGDAGQCLDILPLLCFFAIQIMNACDELQPHIKSLCALWHVTSHILTAKNNVEAVHGLQRLQSKHLQLFVECYGVDKVRPKHHFAGHIEQQAVQSGVLLDCFPGERKNAVFKNVLCPKITRLHGFEKSILLRFLEYDLTNLEKFAGNRVTLKTEVGEAKDGIKLSKGLVCSWGEVKSGHIFLVGPGEAMQVIGCMQEFLCSNVDILI